MRILYINRSKDSGPSIRRVFQPIIERISESHDVDLLYVPSARADFFSLMHNILHVKRFLKDKPRYDIIHITGEINYLLLILIGAKTVVTVHDLGLYTKSKRTLKKRLFYLLWIAPLKLAKAITFISESSAQEANQIINLSMVQQAVIPNSYGKSYQYCPKILNRDCPTILHIGNKANKNLSRVIRAVSSLSCKLTIIGVLQPEQVHFLNEKRISYESYHNLSDDDILCKYKECDIVSFPSTYEGFGMPIIEGQAIGRPVVTSNLSPMKEIAGKGAILVDPYSIESIKKGFVDAIENYNQVVDCGLTNALQYSLENTVNQYLQLYYRIILN